MFLILPSYTHLFSEVPMSPAEILAIITIGISIFVGALRMSPNRFIPVFLVGGWIIVATGCMTLIWESSSFVSW
jgi:hypothetical protein